MPASRLPLAPWILGAIMALGPGSAFHADAASLRGQAAAGSRTGLHVLAVLVTDPDWSRKWAGKTPGVSFHSTDTLYAGQSGTVTLLFSNPSLKNGRARIACDVVVRDSATGSVSRISPQVCFDGPIKRPSAAYLTSVAVKLSEDTSSRRGVINVSAGLTDLNSGVRVPVSLAIMGDPSRPPARRR